MTLTKVLPQDLLNDIVPAGEDKPMVGASKYYGTDASGDFGFFPLVSTTEIVYKTANYTILNTDMGKVIAFDTSAGTLTTTLPLANSVSNGEAIYIKLWNGTNTMSINTSGSDFIDNGLVTTQLKLDNTNRTGIKLVSDGVDKRLAVLDFTGKADVAFGEVPATKLWISANNGQFTEADINTGAVVNVYTPSADCNGCFTYTGMDRILIQHTSPSGGNTFNDTANTFTAITSVHNLVPYISKNKLYSLDTVVANTLTIRNIDTLVVVASIPLGFSTNFGGDYITEDETYYYVSNFNNNRLLRVNKLSFVVNNVVVTTNPMGIVVANGKIYVGSGTTSNISVVDQTGFTLIATIVTTAGSRPAYGTWNKSNKIYFADRSGTARVFVINAVTNALLGNVTGSTGSNYVEAGGIQYGNNDRVYVASRGDGSVKVINTLTDAQIASRAFATAQGLTIS